MNMAPKQLLASMPRRDWIAWKFYRALAVDKKNTGVDPAFVLLRRIGASLIGVRIPAPMVQALVQ